MSDFSDSGDLVVWAWFSGKLNVVVDLLFGSYGTGDDCTGGTGGFDSAVYHDAERASGDTVYCTTDIDAALPPGSFAVVQFRQR